MALTTGKIFVDFFFKYFRWSWKERYFSASVDSLDGALQAANPLAVARIKLLGSTFDKDSSPYLDRIIASRDTTLGDSAEDTYFRDNSYNIAFGFGNPQPADPRFTILWRTSANSGYGKPREMGGIPAYLLAVIEPNKDPEFAPLFAQFQTALKTGGWGYAAGGSGPGAAPSNKISLIEEGDEDGTVNVFAKSLPAPEQRVEIYYARFIEPSVHLSGTFDVLSVGPGYFSIPFGAGAPHLMKYRSGGIWRFPAPRVIPFDGTGIIIGPGIRQRGYKAHANAGRSKSRPPRVF